jgi:2-polyprenyl-6-methoxyphenol hydroxylase-like FAD-dependent oxidoreductase
MGRLRCRESVLRFASRLADVPTAGPVLDQLHGADDLLYSHYHDVVMWPWNTERVVYVGDAAHATSPQLGQGCNLALLDAWALAESLEGAESVADGLFRYSRAAGGTWPGTS